MACPRFCRLLFYRELFPTMRSPGLSLVSLLTSCPSSFFTISSLGAFPGVAMSVLLIDWIGRKPLLPMTYALCALSCYVIFPAYQHGEEVWLTIASFFYQVFYTASWSTGLSSSSPPPC